MALLQNKLSMIFFGSRKKMSIFSDEKLKDYFKGKKKLKNLSSFSFNEIIQITFLRISKI